MKTESIRQAKDLCDRLRERKDDTLCTEAAEEIEGTLIAFSCLVDQITQCREDLRNTRKNLDSTHRLLARIPLAVRLEAVHGKMMEERR